MLRGIAGLLLRCLLRSIASLWPCRLLRGIASLLLRCLLRSIADLWLSCLLTLLTCEVAATLYTIIDGNVVTLFTHIVAALLTGHFSID